MNKTLFSALSLLTIALAVGAASGRFPSTDPDLRIGTPDDPEYDCAESDDEDGQSCAGDLFTQSVNLFGFAPSYGPQPPPVPPTGIPPPPTNIATYLEGPKMGEGQVSGVSADSAWKVSIGRFDATVAVTDTGIRWNNNGVRLRVRLNEKELPRPRNAAGTVLTNPSDVIFNGYDVNGDGAFNVMDYNDDARVDKNAGPDGIADAIDAQDVLRAFSDGTDADSNGYIDDIAGWDFFEDDNDASDTTSYSAAGGHGTGRMNDAAEEGDDAAGNIGVCPRCSVMPLRVWDTFVTPGDTWAAAMVYAADQGVLATVAAIGMLQNTPSSKAANDYAASKGVALMQVSSDLNTANHNYPTNYNDSIYINGCVADVHGLSSEFFDFGGSGSFGVPVQTWFRNSGLTQFGAKATVCFVGVTGSIDTGQAGGAGGLLHSRGLEVAAQIGGRLTSNEVKQLLTMTAEDVTPGNTLGLGTPDPSQVGFDEQFGYGRAHLGDAIRRIAPEKLPPEALIESPAWWHLLDPGTANTSKTVPITGFARAKRATACTYTLEYGLGIEPEEGSYTEFASSACPTGDDATLGALPLDEIADAITGSRTGTFTQSAAARANVNQHTFTVRLAVTDNFGNRGEDRKVYFAHHDPTWTAGWPKFVDVGGETSPTLVDLDGDGTLEFLDATSGGALCAYRHDGTRLASFNGGACWQLPPTFYAHPDAPGFKSGAVPPVTGGLRTPAVADLDGDFEPDIVLAAGDGRIFVLRADGTVRLTLGIDPANSTPDKRNGRDHPKRGLLGSAVIADLDGLGDGLGDREIIVAALDGFIYVWNGRTGEPRAGFPVEVKEATAPERLDARGELIQTPSLADLDGDGQLEIVTGSGDVIPGEAMPPAGPPPLTGGSGAVLDYILANTAGGQTRVYAYKNDGTPFAGWPKALTGILPDVLPFVGPQHGTAVADFDGDGRDDVIASMTTGNVTVFRGAGTTAAFGSQGAVNGGASSEAGKILNLFENAIVGNIDGRGQLDVAKVGVTVGQVANLLLVGQNLPYNHVVQAWDASAPEPYLAGFPTAHDDYGLLSSPAIANVDGAGANEVIAGSGLYLLNAYTSTGMLAPKFPKLTGGWQFAVPAIADVDGDGKLNLVTSTREGWRFVWNLDGDATTANNSEWWTESHDECRTGRYQTDCRPPNRVKGLKFEGGALQFTAPGDDWGAGMVAKYELRTSAREIVTADDWYLATPLTAVSGSAAGGTAASIPFNAAQSAGFVAILPVDEQGNRAKFVTVQIGDVVAPVLGLALTAMPQNATGDAAATVAAGRFTLANTGTSAVTLNALTFTLGSAGVVDQLTLTQGAMVITVAVPASATQIAVSLPSALTLAPAASLPFTTQARFASGSGGSSTLALTALAAQAGSSTVTATGLPAALGTLTRKTISTAPPPGSIGGAPVAAGGGGRFGGALPLALLLPFITLLALRRRRHP
ncbi:MAG: S8 family serine peptidase [Pseudomonadota bacterium]